MIVIVVVCTNCFTCRYIDEEYTVLPLTVPQVRLSAAYRIHFVSVAI